jgi:hypothetical protein
MLYAVNSIVAPRWEAYSREGLPGLAQLTRQMQERQQFNTTAMWWWTLNPRGASLREAVALRRAGMAVEKAIG